jgi:hypothetical protein
MIYQYTPGLAESGGLINPCLSQSTFAVCVHEESVKQKTAVIKEKIILYLLFIFIEVRP